ncbi:MAG: ABC transporter substrate-binding protein [Candidatus Bipolaricaulota bacterium]|nr:ABC transporter substrate-binding protein [Candidatus Bipolaricaulota bacterium]MBS3791509.1 ABC transporter substrate-binding protein [Candidatus Bipolaricaulota bacterium]
MKKLLIVLLAVSLGIATFSAVPVAQEEEMRIGVAIPSADHGWTGGVVWWAKQAIEDWKEKEPNAEFFLVTADSPNQQVGQVETLMVRDIDVLVILAHQSGPLTPIVEEAAEEGIYIVSVDRGLTKPVSDIYIRGDNAGLGRVSAEWMAEELDGEGKIVALEGIPSVINKERVEAFEGVMDQYPGIEILDSQPANWSTQKGLEIMENYLQKYDEIDAVYAQDDDVLKGVLQAYEESGRDDIEFMLGGAGSKDIIKMIMEGHELVRADVTYPPSMIATGISLGVKAARNETLDGFYQRKLPSDIILRAELVTRENAEEYYYPDSVY